MTKRAFSLFLLLLIAAFGFAEESYLGLYFSGSKIGYVRSSSSDEKLDGKPVTLSESLMVMDAGLLGAAMKMTVASAAWLRPDGSPIRMTFRTESSGRAQLVDAVFVAETILVAIDNNGSKSTKEIALPKDGRVVDDAVNALLAEGAKAGASRTFYILDPTTVSLVKNTAVVRGPKKVVVGEKEVSATHIEVQDPRVSTHVYVSAKGDFIKSEAMGIEMLPITKEEALKTVPPGKPVDLAFGTAIKTDKPLGKIGEIESVTLRVTGKDLSRLPNGGHQKVAGSGNSWTIHIQPVEFVGRAQIQAAAKAQPEWVKPGLNIPSDDPEFRSLAKTVVGGATTVEKAGMKVAEHVHGIMKPNAGIGILRNAKEVLATKEGVCRDYAVLTASLLRAAGIPAKLVSGLVYMEGQFFYHAWVEVWDGAGWVGIDSTLPEGRVTAGHVKLAEGTVESAFNFTFLDNVKVEVLDVKRR